MDRVLRQILSDTPAGREYLAKQDAAKKAKRARNAPTRRAKRETLKERSLRAAIVRDAVFKRADGRCECCCSRTPAEWHHLISGPSRRTSEAVETTAAVCVFCHLDLHRSKFHALAAMRRWAKENGYVDALAAIERRMDKISDVLRTGTCPTSWRTAP